VIENSYDYIIIKLRKIKYADSISVQVQILE